MTNKFYIGFMSGTSVDGIDASLIQTDGKKAIKFITDLHIPYKLPFKNKLRQLFELKFDNSFLEIEQELTMLHIKATQILLNQAKLKSSDIHAIGFHGQTIYHNPSKSITWQMGNPFMLAAETSIRVVFDFRKRDIAYGGQGAPLIPIFHKAIMSDEDNTLAVINIGGVANVTYISGDNLIGFDTGPGNALIDDAALKYFQVNYDKDGLIARSGKVDFEFVNSILERPYFSMPFPKSLDRNEFHEEINERYYKKSLLQESVFMRTHNSDKLLSTTGNDVLATLTYLTAATIAHGINQLPLFPSKIYLCGGGSRNIYLTEVISDLVNKNNKCEVLNISQKDSLNPDFIESQGFAYLAARCCNNLPSTFPSTTGARISNVCGVIV